MTNTQTTLIVGAIMFAGLVIAGALSNGTGARAESDGIFTMQVGGTGTVYIMQKSTGAVHYCSVLDGCHAMGKP